MPEASSEVISNPIDPEVRQAWEPHIGKEKDQYTRSVMMELARRGIRPPDDLPEAEARDKVKQMTTAELDREFKKVTAGLKEHERDPQQLEKMAEDYIEKIKSEGHVGGGSQAPGEILRTDEEDWNDPKGEVASKLRRGLQVHDIERINEIKADWSDINGWNTGKIKEVGHKLKNLFGSSITYNQIRNALEIFVGSGQAPGDLLPKLEDSNYQRYITGEDARAYAQSERIPPKLSFFSHELGIDEDYAKKFIIDSDFKSENESEYQNTDPDSMEAVAWQAMYHYGMDKWGPSGEFPLLEMRYDKDTGRGKYYVNQANMVIWLRDRMWYQYDLSPDSAHDFFKVGLEKSYRPLELTTMFLTPGRYFKSEDGKTDYYDTLGLQWVTEAWAASTLRSWDVNYKKAMHDPGELMKTLQSIFSENTLTKSAFRKNLFNLMARMPLNFEGSEKNELPKSDNIMGACWNDIFQAYYNLSDFDELQRVWGEESSFFTKKGFDRAFKFAIRDKATDASGESKFRGLGSRELHEEYEKAFDKDTGRVLEGNRDHFTKLISNFLAVKMNNTNIEETLRVMMRNAAAEKYGKLVKDKKEIGEDGEPVEKYALVTEKGIEDDRSLRMAEINAFSMIRIFGAGARNDPTASGYDFFNKMHYMQTYRAKMPGKNGDAAGNLYTIPQFKMLAVDAPNAIVTNSEKIIGYKAVKDKDGNMVRKPIYQAKSIMEVMKELSAQTTIYTQKLRQMENAWKTTPEGPMRDIKKIEYEKFRKDMNQVIQNKSGELEFKQSALSNYYDDHVMRAQKTWEILMKAKEVTMDKYVQYDAWGGVRFNRAQFQEDVQDNIIHHIRYFLNTYPDLNYNMKIKAMDQDLTFKNKGVPIFREMTLGEAMFGHELLNREAFWKKDSKHKPICMVDKNGKPMKGIYEIDYDKVNNNKVLVWKQWFATKMVGDLWSHRAFHSTDSRFDLNYYKNVVAAIESIPGEIKQDEYSIRQQVVGTKFFDKRDMAWIKKGAKVENYNLYLRSVFRDIFLPDEPQSGIGLLEAFSLLTRQIVKSGG